LSDEQISAIEARLRSAPSPTASNMAACCFLMVQHRVRLLRWLLLRRGYALAPSPTASNMAACCFLMVQHRVRLLRWLLPRRGYALAPSPAVCALLCVVQGLSLFAALRRKLMEPSETALFAALRRKLMEPSETALFGARRRAKRKARPPVVWGTAPCARKRR
jgi:hypothetical protein